MLCLSREINQRIFIGDDIVIKVVRMDKRQVCIGIDAPAGVKVLREELLCRQVPGNVTKPVDGAASDLDEGINVTGPSAGATRDGTTPGAALPPSHVLRAHPAPGGEGGAL